MGKNLRRQTWKNNLRLGGANPQIVKAVLDNLGRRYLVEHGETEDGWQYDLYSDGYLRQKLVFELSKASSSISQQLTYPIEFSDLEYLIFVQAFRRNNADQGRQTASSAINKTTTGAKCGWYAGNTVNSQDGMSILVEGYAA